MRYRDIYAKHLREVLSPAAWEEKDMEEVLDYFYFYELPKDFHKTNPQDMKCICEIQLAITPFCYEHIHLDSFIRPISRYIAFLESDKFYVWENIRPDFYQSLIKIFTLGMVDKFQKSIKIQGDINYWPFINREEYLSVLCVVMPEPGCPVRTADTSVLC